jgi:ATP-dependent Clp protease ATP-binding subunit ClpA
LLWALLQDEKGAATTVLRRRAIEPTALMDAIESQIAAGADAGAENDRPAGGLALTPEARRVLDLAGAEAERMPLRAPYVGTEHLLLGLLAEKENLPASYLVLRNAGLTLAGTRGAVLIYLREKGSLTD